MGRDPVSMRRVGFWLVGALAVGFGYGCGAGAGSSGTVNRVDVTSQVGGLGAAELRNDGGVARHVIDHPPAAVWRVLPDVYERLGIADAGLDPSEGVYGSRNFRARRIENERLSTFVDCGMGPTATPRADEYDVRMTVVTGVWEGEGGTTRLGTTVQAVGRPRGVSGNPVDCASRGSLEARIATLVTLALLNEDGREARPRR
jgi:hypothetical protein